MARRDGKKPCTPDTGNSVRIIRLQLWLSGFWGIRRDRISARRTPGIGWAIYHVYPLQIVTNVPETSFQI